MLPTKLPIGIQDFEKLRKGNYIYVDKTKYLIDMIENGTVYFLSRPRRFGKSLTISTFDALFSGKRELFKGLYAEKFLSAPDFEPSPVIRIDMSETITDHTIAELRSSMLEQVKYNAIRYDVRIESDVPGIAFNQLIKGLARQENKVVILIDEYDKPILDCISKPDKAQEFREALRNFYIQIKANDAHTRFVFFTGISKFAKAGVFSAMNNLRDISLYEDYSEMFGYTKEEIEVNFKVHLEKIVQKIGVSYEELYEKIRAYYNGFSFDGEHSVYNPFSMLNFLDEGKFRNFWFESGSPTFIIDYIKNKNISVEHYRGYAVAEDFADKKEIEHAEPASFLFQAGYLTFKDKQGEKYILDYPNKEVLVSISRLYASDVFKISEGYDAFAFDLKDAFNAGDIDEIVACFNRLLAAVPYGIFRPEEKFYHGALLIFMWGSGINTQAEVQTHRGRSDIVAMHAGKNYVIELKIAVGEEAAKKAAHAAIEQIHEKGYAQKYEDAVCLGFGIDTEARQIWCEQEE